MRKKTAALYDPYLDTLGGGEKHILSILKVLDDEDYKLAIFWNKNIQQKINQRFSFQFNVKLEWKPNIFLSSYSLIQKLSYLKKFDLFFYVTDGSYFFSSAKKNFVFCMIPDKKLYQMNTLNKLKTLNYKFITNSHFTQSHLKEFGIQSTVIYPFISQDLIDLKIENLKKDKIILSVGRFFSHLHSKKQSETIKLFKYLRQKNPLFKNFKLILAGGLKDEGKPYFECLKKETLNEPDIILKANISYNELLEFYKKSAFYLHLAGLGVDENKNPELVEHLGISPLEAMSSGCITFAYNAGGPKELIKDGVNGFLFNNESELIDKMSLIIPNKERQKLIRFESKKYVSQNFNYQVFKSKVKQIIL